MGQQMGSSGRTLRTRDSTSTGSAKSSITRLDKTGSLCYFSFISLCICISHLWFNRYGVTRQAFVRNNGYALLSKFGHSYSRALIAIYSDFEFLPWLFGKVAHGYFTVRENRVRYVEWLKRRTGLKESELQAKHFMENHGLGLLVTYGSSPERVLQSLRSDNLDPVKKSRRHWVPSLHLLPLLQVGRAYSFLGEY